MSSTKPFHECVAERLIELLRAGTAPWQRPWEPGVSYLPMNPITRNRYQGINTIQLLMQGRGDPRWMTYRQARNAAAHVREGEKGTPIQYWRFTEQRTGLVVQLERPRVSYAVVFNAEQIEGLPALEHKARTSEPVERAETILTNSGATIEHGGDRAFYSLIDDRVRLPHQGQFARAADYYATALHELGHWTGHPRRLDRDLSHPFDGAVYAREELRAEIASLILGDELGLGHDPAQHAAYVGHWIRALQQDPLEVFRAASAAEKIRDYVLGLEQHQEHQSAQLQEAGEGLPMTAQRDAESLDRTARRYLAVPYRERRQAFDAGARWDPGAHCWYAGAGASMDKLERWLPDNVAVRQAPASDPREEFAAALREMGCVLGNDGPLMDGARHRVPVEGDRRGERSGFYVAHLDGRPAGYAKNHRTGDEMRWKAKGYRLDPAEQASLRAEAATKLQQRAAEQERDYRDTAARLEQELKLLAPATLPTAYMEAKRIGLHPGVYTDSERKTYVPATDAEGKLWTIQTIDREGNKRFAKGSRKHGCFHTVGGLSRLAAADVVVIAEGYATAVTVMELLGKPAVAAFDAGNLLPVAQALHDRYPSRPVLIVADDDQRQERERGVNPGRQKAQEAAKAVGGRVVLPIFAPAEQRETPALFSDFNDLAVRSVLGREGAVSQLRYAYDQALREHRSRLEQKVTQDRIQPKAQRAL